MPQDLQPLLLRPFTPSDYSALISWLPNEQDFYLFSGTPAGWPVTESALAERAAQEGIHAWTAVLATSHTTPVGHIEFVRTTPDAGRFARVLIDPNFRGQGLARHLTGLGLTAARGLGMRRVDLNVVIGNEPALRTYSAMGFRFLGVNPDYPTMLRMTRSLGAADDQSDP